MSISEKISSAIGWIGKVLLGGVTAVILGFGGALLIVFFVELKNQFVLPSLIIAASIIVAAVILRDRPR